MVEQGLYCRKCSKCIAPLDHIAFFQRPPDIIHLVVKPTFHADYVKESSTLRLKEQKEKRKQRQSAWMLHCSACDVYFGNEYFFGPDREPLLAFNVLDCGFLVNGALSPVVSWKEMHSKAASMYGVDLPTITLLNFHGDDAITRPSMKSSEPILRPTLEDLRNSNIHWTKSEPRPYQWECLVTAATHPASLVYIPTGGGKTLVAAMAARALRHFNPRRQVVFVVDRVPLVFQQGHYLRGQCPDWDILIACGEGASALENAKNNALKRKLNEYDVLCCTAQTLINWVEAGRYRLEDVCLLIIDEVHHAVGGHAFVHLLDKYLGKVASEHRPSVLGLTASPARGSTPTGMATSLHRLCLLLACNSTAITANSHNVFSTTKAVVVTPILYGDELKSVLHPPHPLFTLVEGGAGEADLVALIYTFCRRAFVAKLTDLLIASTNDCYTFLGSKGEWSGVELNRSLLRRLQEAAHESRVPLAVKRADALQQAFSAVEMASVLGPLHARDYIIDLISNWRASSWESEDTAIFFEMEMALKATAIDANSPRVDALINILIASLDHEDATTLSNTDVGRTIVFVETRRTARWLAGILDAHPRLHASLHPGYCVGQGTDLEGMSWAEDQKPILKSFSSGDCRLLVATSVLQEGLDVAVCSRIILFDPAAASTLPAFIQARGRARSASSCYHILCTAKEQNAYEELVREEKQLHSLLMKNHTKAVEPPEVIWTIAHLVTAPWKDSNKNTVEANTSSSYSVVFYGSSQHGEAYSPSLLPSLKAWRWEGASSSILDDVQRKLLNSDCPFAQILNFNPNSAVAAFHFLGAGVATERWSLKFQNETVAPTLQRALIAALEVPVKCALEAGVIRIYVVSNDESRIHRIDVDHGAVRDAVFYDTECIYIPLRRPPTLYVTEVGGAHSTTTNVNSKSDGQFSKHRHLLLGASIDGHAWNRSVNAVVDFVPGSILAISLGQLSNSQRGGLLHALHSMPLPCLVTSLREPIHENANLLKELSKEWPFELAYAVRTVVDDAFISLSDETINAVSEAYNRDPQQLLEALPNWRLKPLLTDPLSELIPLIERQEFLVVRQVPENTFLVRSATVTPSRVIINAIRGMPGNRVLRHFGPQPFLRIHFRDEDGAKLSSVRGGGACMAGALERLRCILHHGLSLNGRHYAFLAMSSSQLREHGCWFVTSQDSDELNRSSFEFADAIRAWMGNFSGIKVVAKYVARLGQSLSASQNTVCRRHSEDPYPIESSFEVESIEDVERNGYCFTDGIGMISPALAVDVASRITSPHLLISYDGLCTSYHSSSRVSAFQIRFAGFKGVVAVNPRLPWPTDSESEDVSIRKLWLRKSQDKFKSEHGDLEVLNRSQPIPCYLNRQVVMILSALGVEDSAFAAMQDEMLRGMAEMLVEPGLASRSLQAHFLLPDLVDVSMVDPSEPFTRGMLRAIYGSQLSDLLNRTRIRVPHGRILMGVIDELGVLAEDEVFVQISLKELDDVYSQYQEGPMGSVVVGDVVLAKNPCMHPGDVRRLKAVWNERLSHYFTDVVVFPQTGVRPIPDQCSGSDLDGDLYFVAWEPRLLPSKTTAAMDYSSTNKEIARDKIALEDVVAFTVAFIANDQLGAIANAHVAHADSRPLGVSDPLCQHLARLFSLAVDFPKTGVVAALPAEARVQEWPDFMQKGDRPSYPSQKVIGKLFRKAASIALICDEHCADEDGIEDDTMSPLSVVYKRYAEGIQSILRTYRLASEFALFTGCTSSSSEDDGSREDGRNDLSIAIATARALILRCRQEMNQLSLPAEVILGESQRLVLRVKGSFKSFPRLVCQNKTPPRTTSSWLTRLGEDAKRKFIEFVRDEDVLAGWVQRRDLARSLPIPVEITGCTRWMLFTPTATKMEMVVVDETIELKNAWRALRPQFGSTLQILDEGKHISYPGRPFPFSIYMNSGLDITPDVLIETAIRVDPYNLPLLHAVLAWAQAASLPWNPRDLLMLTLRMLNLLPSLSNVFASGLEIEAWIALIERIRNDDNHVVSVQTLGYRLGTLFRALAFAPLRTLNELIRSRYCMAIEENAILMLHEHAFRMFHGLVQAGGNLSFALRTAYTHADAVRRDSRSSMQIQRRKKDKKATSSFFMPGSSAMLFPSAWDGARVQFDLYQLRRRPRHATKQCYQPKLLVDDSSGEGEAALFAKFYAHACRQLALARRASQGNSKTSIASDSSLRLQVKYGNCYLTNLPRLFVEEASAATVEAVQRALSKGYTAVRANDVGDDSAVDDSLVDDLAVDDEEVEEAEDVAIEIDKTTTTDFNASADGVGMARARVARRKPPLTPMSSAFEPGLESASPTVLGQLREMVEIGLAYHCPDGARAGFSFHGPISIDKRSLTGTMIYDSLGTFVKGFRQSLRWLLSDIRPASNASAHSSAMDVRVVVTSSRPLGPEPSLLDVLFPTENEEFQTGCPFDVIDGNVQLKAEWMRANAVAVRDSDVMIRETLLERFLPTAASLNLMLRDKEIYTAFAMAALTDPALIASLLPLFTVNIMRVREWSECRDDGTFASLQEKIEVELGIPTAADLATLNDTANGPRLTIEEWIEGDGLRDRLIRGIWGMARVGSILLSRLHQA